MQLEDELVRELSHVFETAFRPGALPRGLSEGCSDQDDEQGRHADSRTVPTDELSDPVSTRVGPCQYGPAIEVALDVRRELLGGRVAPARVLLHRLQDDRVEVSREGACEPGVAANGKTRTHRLLLHDCARELVRRFRRDAIGPATRQDHVEKSSQRVDVARRSDGLPFHLLGARVRGREDP